MITHIHHVNFLVNDLDQAIARYEALLAGQMFQRDSLEQRAVKTARVKLGQTWLILVQPTDSDSEPAKYLKQHGEGFFLLSLGTDDLDGEESRLSNQQIEFSSSERRGLNDWRVRDLRIEDFFGAQIQLAEEVNSEL